MESTSPFTALPQKQSHLYNILLVTNKSQVCPDSRGKESNPISIREWKDLRRTYGMGDNLGPSLENTICHRAQSTNKFKKNNDM